MWSLSVYPNYIKKILLFFSPSIRMSGKNLNFGNKKKSKNWLLQNKKVAKIDDINVNKILVSKK